MSDQLYRLTYSRRRWSGHYWRGCDVRQLLRRFFEVAVRGRAGPAALRSLLVERDPRWRRLKVTSQRCFEILRDGGLPTPVRQFEVVVAGNASYRCGLPRADDLHEGDGFGVIRRVVPSSATARDKPVGGGRLVPLRFTWRRLAESRGCVVRCTQPGPSASPDLVAVSHLRVARYTSSGRDRPRAHKLASSDGAGVRLRRSCVGWV